MEEHDKALFDFDQDIDDLEKVEERYPAQHSRMITEVKPGDLVEDADKENKNVANSAPENKKEPEPAKTKVPVMYQVKRTERPAFSSDVLADLARIRA